MFSCHVHRDTPRESDDDADQQQQQQQQNADNNLASTATGTSATDETDSAFFQADDSRDGIAEPIYHLISEVFELRGVFGWLRRTLVTFVQITYGRTINRFVLISFLSFARCTFGIDSPSMPHSSFIRMQSIARRRFQSLYRSGRPKLRSNVSQDLVA